jgi:GT2 family glycosyltransferase
MLIRAPDASFSTSLLLSPAPGLFLGVWEAPAAQRIAIALASGRSVHRPFATLRLERPDRPTRHVLAFRADAEPGDEITIRDGTETRLACAINEAAADPAPLFDGLDGALKAQLLRFLLGYCRSAFRLSGNSQFAAFAHRLALAAAPAREALAPFASIGSIGVLWRGRPKHAASPQAVYIIDSDRVSANPVSALIRGEGDEVILATAPGARGRAVALFTGSDAVSCHALPSPAAIPSLVERAERRELGVLERRYVLRFLGALAAQPEAAQLARGLALAAAEPPKRLVDKSRPIAGALELAIDCGEAGLYAHGWLRDPHGLVTTATLVSPFGERSILPSWHRLDRPEIERQFAAAAHQAPDARHGFIARLADLREPIPVLQHRLVLSAAGAPIELVSAPRTMSDVEARNAILGTISDRELTPAILDQTVAPAAAALHARVMKRTRRFEVVAFGTAPKRPRASIVIPLYKNLSFLRFQLAAFAVDPEMRASEIIFVLDSPEQRAEVEHLLTGLHALYELPLKLVVMPMNLGYAAANNAGAEFAAGRALLLLNSDVIPAAPGWLGTMLAALDRDGIAAVGPKLLFDDGSLQHAGLYFDRDAKGAWYNRHYFKGYPRDFAPAARAREVPGVTGAALLVRREIYEAVHGLTEDFIIGDYEDSDLCLKIRGSGYAIRYEPAAELYHFERQSIRHHAGYTRTIACAYNRRLHAARWDTAMGDVMRRFDASTGEDERPRKSRRAA